jgi:hypothetical protein
MNARRAYAQIVSILTMRWDAHIDHCPQCRQAVFRKIEKLCPLGHALEATSSFAQKQAEQIPIT